MANYAVSVLAKGQSVVTSKYQTPEQRRKRPTVLNLALKNAEISIPNANDLRVAPTRVVDINYFVNIAPGSDTAKTARHTGTYGDSAKINLVYVKHVEKFSMPRKIADGNFVTYQAMFNNLYEMKWKNLITRHDNTGLAFVIANRCQLAAAAMNPQIASAAPGTWNETNFALEISLADRPRYIQRVEAFMDARFLGGQYDMIADLQTIQELEFQRAQGAGNSQNLSFQFGNTDVVVTQDVISEDYAKGASLVLPKGMLSGFTYNEPLNRRGVEEDGYVGSLGTVSDPFGLGAVADISRYTDRADTSANTTGGSTQDIVDQWEIALEVAYALPPLSTTGDSVLHLIGQKAS